ncbi:non-heme iron oxygenase ferredoxin subunit [Caballeronia sp. LP006]|uniref:non-heme iron oxygenase ferredoxin subunit n=1 Tax=unclassified Caballeronia TaxID=2646786 RepID=UPI001FD5105C|nr:MULTISPECIES: non-heme iron oxygenase ferredoxin subunit [unclassified Caballeronia]MDR5774403.1 non-heme iron oxygenase ferredoxin subunit [Caballeronia sp. LZ002]MDR5805934.1 non-heme iron oxygenase ferredoxin subunit [Caballeronia sp. LZ001]MDR5826387.1 non-heme iron oxygenase ferredoxin subunit [Caballeronia sp. LP006]MDR5849838.1 non-heme iron oxygenase ferredoxin subunit [Caballeronia sp. LZ003]
MTQWIDAAALDDIDDEDVKRFDHDGRTFAIYRVNDEVFASDGLCTHEQVHLSEGFLFDHVIECPKHNGQFDIRDGRALGAPVCINLQTYPAKVQDGRIFVEI